MGRIPSAKKKKSKSVPSETKTEPEASDTATQFLSDILGEDADVRPTKSLVRDNPPAKSQPKPSAQVDAPPAQLSEKEARKRYMVNHPALVLRGCLQSSKISDVRKWDKVAPSQAKEYRKPMEETFKSLSQEVMELGN